jgi:hypothetical protein
MKGDLTPKGQVQTPVLRKHALLVRIFYPLLLAPARLQPLQGVKFQATPIFFLLYPANIQKSHEPWLKETPTHSEFYLPAPLLPPTSKPALPV